MLFYATTETKTQEHLSHISLTMKIVLLPRRRQSSFYPAAKRNPRLWVIPDPPGRLALVVFSIVGLGKFMELTVSRLGKLLGLTVQSPARFWSLLYVLTRHVTARVVPEKTTARTRHVTVHLNAVVYAQPCTGVLPRVCSLREQGY